MPGHPQPCRTTIMFWESTQTFHLVSDEGLGSNSMQQSKNREAVNSKLREVPVEERKMIAV